MKYHMDVVREIFGEGRGGFYFEVGPDRDGLGMIEIREKSEGKTTKYFVFPIESASLITDAITKCAKEIEESYKQV